MATEQERARRYRKRRTAKLAAMEAGLRAILAKLDGNDKALANELRDIAQNALNPGDAK